jgi:glycosyltransferase involved in cell wall biosynthesis
MRALVVVPTYNEAASIGELVSRVLAADPNLDILVVDDGSAKGTAGLVKAIMAGNPGIHLLERAAKQGLGTAYRAGFVWGLTHLYDVLIEIDADLSHPPADSGAARRPSPRRCGDRFSIRAWRPSCQLKQGPDGAKPSWQLLYTSGSPLTLHDATAGFRAYPRAVLQSLPIDSIQSNGYCFQVEMAYRAWQRGFLIAKSRSPSQKGKPASQR